jgi:nucleotide-binding universal stress UspA family protein
MPTFRKVLFPVDFSARCVQFAPYVAGFARKFGSEVALFHALHIYDPFGYGAASSTTVYGGSETEVRNLHQRALAEFAGDAFTGITTIRVAEVGEPSERIISYAEEHGMDVIFMPTHGRGQFRRLLLGSVTAKVLHDARIPVWTSAHCESAGDSSTGRHDIRNIICAVDLSPDAIRVIRTAAALAAAYGAAVRIVHAIPAAEAGEFSTSDECFRRFLFDTATEQLAARQQQAGMRFESYIRQGRVAITLKEAAMNFNADLVVIGRGRLQGFLGRLRTNVSAIIRESPCPVFSV